MASVTGVTTREPTGVTRSVVRSICDTATALIGKFRPKASIVTDGGDWNIQQQAMDLDRFLVGAYTVGKVYPVAARGFHDSTVFGTGGWKLVPTGEGKKFRVMAEHFLIDDLVVDEHECREHPEPVNTYHRTMMSAAHLIKLYASGNKREDKAKKAAIEAAKGRGGDSWPGGRHVRADQCIVIEAIYVDPAGGAGRRVVSVQDCVLVDESWDFPWHPFVFLHWSPPLSGFYGDGVAYRQYGRQKRIDYLYRWIQRCHDLFATPRAWVDPMGGPPTLQLSNDIGAVITSRKPPVFQTQEVVPPEIYRWLDALERGGFEDEGISQASASNQLPAGIESAPAQREYSFKESSRFAPVSQRWEHAVAIETATKMIAMYRAEFMRSKEGAQVPWADRGLRETIDWADVQLDENAYQIRAEASSLEALSPSSRTQAAIELSQTGWITPQEGRALLGHPDLEKSDQLGSAPRRYAMWVLRHLLKGEPVQVNEYAHLESLHEVIQNGYVDALTRKVPEDIKANLERYLEDLDVIMHPQPDPAMAAMAGGMPMPGAPMPGAPMPALADPAAQGMPAPFPGG